MKVRVNWKELLINLTFWLVSEMILDLTGLNDLSNYSEFILQQHKIEFQRV
jgi:hypothetical protein